MEGQADVMGAWPTHSNGTGIGQYFINIYSLTVTLTVGLRYFSYCTEKLDMGLIPSQVKPICQRQKKKQQANLVFTVCLTGIQQ